MTAEFEVSPYAPQPSPYGRFIRERGTRNLVLVAILLGLCWYAYSAVHTSLMMQVKWPTLKPQPNGLTVVGLRDRDRPGWHHNMEARESNHAWQIREAEDSEAAADDEETTPEANDKTGAFDPGQYSHGNSGKVIPVEKVLATCPVVLVGEDFSSARIVSDYAEFYDRPFYKLQIDLTPEGRSRYWQWSHVHEKERIAFIMGNQVIACPRMSNVDVTTLTIDPIWIKSDAEQLASYINNEKR